MSGPKNYSSCIDDANEILKNYLQNVIDETKKNFRECDYLVAAPSNLKNEPHETSTTSDYLAKNLTTESTEVCSSSNEWTNNDKSSKTSYCLSHETIECTDFMDLNESTSKTRDDFTDNE